MVDAGVGEGTGTGRGDDVEGIKLELENGAGRAEEVGIAGVGADELKISTALESTGPLPSAHNDESSQRAQHTALLQCMHPPPHIPLTPHASLQSSQ